MDFVIWCLRCLSSILNPAAENFPTACEAVEYIITANTPSQYDEEGNEPHFDHRLMPIVAIVYPYCREEFIARGTEDLGANWRPGMELRESKQFRSDPAIQNVYYCDPIDWGALAKLAEFTGQPVKEVNIWKREQAIDLLYASERRCEGCGDYHWMVVNPKGYEELQAAAAPKKELEQAATDIGLEYLNFFAHGFGDCNFHEDGSPSNVSYFGIEDLTQGITWLKTARWSNKRIKMEVQSIIPRLEDSNPDLVKEAVQAVNNELAKL